ncbi:MAG: hypothetical protein H6607_05375 [Flavobacteriales bacterium]|nr:hypothetical protein [Flavobacteriales bacterium]
MKFNDITFPHPVLGLGDAIFGTIELGNPEINSLQDVYEVNINCKNDNADLKNLLTDDKAEFLYEVTCTNTLYRKRFLSNNGRMEFEIPKKEVKGRVEFTCLLVAKERIPEYSNTESHSDYDGYTFDLDQGDILAYFGEFSFNADIKYEKLKAVSSFMEIVENEDLKYTNVDLKKNKIEIQLPSETYDIYRSDLISQEVKFVPVFHSSIVLNALLTALYNFDEHKEYLWAKVIDYRLKKEKQFELLDIAEKENIPEIAQRLLGNPFKRLLEGLNVIIESESEE